MVPEIALGMKTYIKYDLYLDSADLIKLRRKICLKKVHQNLTLYALQTYI